MDFSNHQTLLIAYASSNLVALVLVLLSWKKPVIARFLYVLLFVWVSGVNVNTALYAPQLYLDYAEHAFFAFYRDFIEGFFSQHITAIVSTIAVCQFLIGISLLLKGKIFQLGALGGILFLVSIAPLGVGSAFPSSLIMAAGLYLLLQQNVDRYGWQTLQKQKNS